MILEFTPTARKQLLEALSYISRDNPEAPRRLRRKSEASLVRLTEFPDSGRLIPEFPDLPYREVVLSPYRFFYRVHESTVWVVAVRHSAQLPGDPTRT